MQVLNDFYSFEGKERVGFIVGDKITEVRNIASDPEQGFKVSFEDIVKYEDIADATWHTHPSQNSNLSEEDSVLIKNWPDMKHYIIGNDGVSCYQYDREKKAIIWLK